MEYLIYPDGSEAHYAYDVNNNLISVTDWSGRVTTYTYDENNRVIGVTKPDGSTTTTVYDDKQRIVSTVEKLPDDTIISGFEYEYDEIGRISTEKVLAKNQKMCYTYDEQSRVVKRTVISLSGTTETEEAFSYDGAGNVTADNSHTFVYDTNNRLTQYNGNAVTYDEDGNMLSATLNGEETTFSFDSGNRLISAGGHTYIYDAENVRIRNLCTDADTTYVYNTNCKLSQMLCKTTNGITTKYVYGLGLIGEEKCGEFKTYHFDFRGSTVAITDANGNITDTFAYDTYGRLTERTGTSFVIFGYNGRDGVVTDKNGLIYMRARYYSPELRRFINADIVSGSLDNSVTLNRFAYANGNPASLIDPFGLSVDKRGNSENKSSPTWYEEAWSFFWQNFSDTGIRLIETFLAMGDSIEFEASLGSGIGGDLKITDYFDLEIVNKADFIYIAHKNGKYYFGGLETQKFAVSLLEQTPIGPYYEKYYPYDGCNASECTHIEVWADGEGQQEFDPSFVIGVGLSGYFVMGISASIGFNIEHYLNKSIEIWTQSKLAQNIDNLVNSFS